MASLCNILSILPSRKPSVLSPSSSNPFSFPSLTFSCSRYDGLVPMRRTGSFPSSSCNSLSVGWPSLTRAKTLLFASGYNVQVVVEDNEPEDSLVRRFRTKVFRAGVIQECKRRRFFENKQEEKKRRVREASKRNRRRRYPPKARQYDRQEPEKKTNKVEVEDNWELPEGGLPS